MINRRDLLRGAGLGAAATLVGGCANDDGAKVRKKRVAVAADTDAESVIYPFRDIPHQAGVLAPLTAHGIVAGFDIRGDTVDDARAALESLSAAVEKVMSAKPYEARHGGFPAKDTGLFGDDYGPTSTSVIVGFGDSLFDERFGFADKKPIDLQPMPKFANDYMVKPERAHGDIGIMISADTADAAVHAMRQIRRGTRGLLVPRWQQEGHNTLIPESERKGGAPIRNLMGFKDGSANIDASDDALMNEIVWIGEDSGQPEWAIGGTYLAIRVIRMMIEFWDRTRLNEQEEIFGRNRVTGAPHGKQRETDEPEFGDDLTSHIARANPRQGEETQKNRLFRKGFNYTNGIDDNDQLDQGLVFIAFQHTLTDGFVAVQRRLDGEALEEYIRPQAGGFFFVPPPPTDGEFLGQKLFD